MDQMIAAMYEFGRELPYAECNPIDPEGRLLVGAFPRSEREVDGLLAYGVDILIVTDRRHQRAKERYPQLERVELIFLDCAPGGKVSLFSHNVPQLTKELIESHRQGKTVMFSSMMGCGRAEMMGSIFIGMVEDITAPKAIERVGWWRTATRRSKEYACVPPVETNVQVRFVHQCLSNERPDRSDRGWAKHFNIERRRVQKQFDDW